MKHTPRKRFGQNFLIDSSTIQRIVQTIAPDKNQHLVEIGPGQGALTQLLSKKAGQLDLIEIDRDLIKILQEKFGLSQTALDPADPSIPRQARDSGPRDDGVSSSIRLYSQDALTFDFSELILNQQKLRLVGNLPYNISTPLIFHLLKFSALIEDMHFMLQKEVVDRLAATPDNADWGRLSVMVQYHCEVHAMFQVPPSAFDPPPKVQSAIVQLIPWHTLPHVANDYALFANIVRTAFTKRRKMIRNALKDFVTDDTLWQKLNIDPERRPEELSVGEYVKISNSPYAAPSS